MGEILTYRQIPNDEFKDKIDDFTDVFADALFRTPPYSGFLLDYRQTRKRLFDEANEEGFVAFIAERNAKLIAANTYGVYPNPTEFLQKVLVMEQEKIFDFLTNHQKDNMSIDWASRLFTHPDFQRKGVGSSLRQFALTHLRVMYPEGLLLFTGHVDTNTNILKISQKMGLLYSGIHVSGEEGHPGYDYYWKYL